MGKIKIKIKNVDSKISTDLEVDTSDDIENIKKAYVEKVNREISVQLKFGGKILLDKQTVKQLELEDGDILQCNERSLGGHLIKF
jgi:hypothetical protein